MLNKGQSKKNRFGKRFFLAAVVLATAIIVVQVGFAAPGNETIQKTLKITISPNLSSTSDFSERKAQESWQTITDRDRGFSLQVPATWYEVDMSKLRYSEWRCFSPIQGDNMVMPQFCVDMNPNISQSPQVFFENINKNKVGESQIEGTVQKIILRKYVLTGYPAVVEVNTRAPDAETEPYYTVNTYINHPRGLIRLFFAAVDEQQYLEFEPLVRQINESFVVLE